MCYILKEKMVYYLFLNGKIPSFAKIFMQINVYEKVLIFIIIANLIIYLMLR